MEFELTYELSIGKMYTGKMSADSRDAAETAATASLLGTKTIRVMAPGDNGTTFINPRHAVTVTVREIKHNA